MSGSIPTYNTLVSVLFGSINLTLCSIFVIVFYSCFCYLGEVGDFTICISTVSARLCFPTSSAPTTTTATPLDYLLSYPRPTIFSSVVTVPLAISLSCVHVESIINCVQQSIVCTYFAYGTYSYLWTGTEWSLMAHIVINLSLSAANMSRN